MQQHLALSREAPCGACNRNIIRRSSKDSSSSVSQAPRKDSDAKIGGGHPTPALNISHWSEQADLNLQIQSETRSPEALALESQAEGTVPTETS